MSDVEMHATRDEDWRVYGNNLAAETNYVGPQFADARRLMLAGWEGWVGGEPAPNEIVYELLSTVWAMAMMTGIERVGPALETMAAMIEQEGG